MSGFKSRLRTICVLLLMLPGMAATMRAQLVPLLPPLEGEPTEEATPQESKAARMLQADLEAERFEELDQIAQRFRESKARVAGGGWRLRQFYTQLLGDPKSDEAVQQHMANRADRKPPAVDGQPAPGAGDAPANGSDQAEGEAGA